MKCSSAVRGLRIGADQPSFSESFPPAVWGLRRGRVEGSAVHACCPSAGLPVSAAAVERAAAERKRGRGIVGRRLYSRRLATSRRCDRAWQVGLTRIGGLDADPREDLSWGIGERAARFAAADGLIMCIWLLCCSSRGAKATIRLCTKANHRRCSRITTSSFLVPSSNVSWRNI